MSSRILILGAAGRIGSAAAGAFRKAGWTVASWLVAHAQAYHLSQVRYAGFSWKAASGSMGWQHESNPTSPSGKTGIVAG